MKNLVKILSLVTCLCLFASVFAGCGESEGEEKGGKNRILYNNADLSKIVTLGEYKNLPVDMQSEEILDLIEDFGISDVKEAGLYNEVKSGKVAKGDIANINYEGKKNGVAFEGGTAEDYDLEIGSGAFIPGFEDKLVGVKVGDTVKLDLTFPKDYHQADLTGKDVVFTVTVNYVKKLKTPQESFEDLGFKSWAAYEKDIKERAVQQYLLNAIVANSKIKEYPKEDIELIYVPYKNQFENNLMNTYGMDFATYLGYTGLTEDAFKTEFIKSQVKPAMENQIIIYAILDKEGLEYDTAKVQENTMQKIKDAGNTTITTDQIKEYYGQYYFEELAVTEAVIDYLYKSADITK